MLKINLGLAIALALAIGVISPVRADDNLSGISGTNIWNNVAPRFDGDRDIDPALVEEIIQFNQSKDTAFQACSASIPASEQVTIPRTFARTPRSIQPPVTPQCAEYNRIIDGGTTLRTRLDEAERARFNPAFRTW